MSVHVYERKVSPAQMMDGRRHVWKLAPDLFKVYGRGGNAYEIPVEAGIPRCPCEAGSRGRKCFHAALVLARLERLEREAASSPEPSDMSIEHASDEGVLAAPVFAVSEFGKARELPVGWAYEVVRFNGVKSCAESVTILARDPEQDWRTDNEVWYVTASALRFEGDPCSQCTHIRSRHRLYFEPGDEEPWSWCDDCGGPCEFVGPGASLGERLGFQPIQSRTHGYNGQEHR